MEKQNKPRKRKVQGPSKSYLRFLDVSEERMEAAKKRWAEQSLEMSQNKDFLLGCMIGEVAWSHHLPTLSCFSHLSGKVIMVDEQDEDFLTYKQADKELSKHYFRPDYEEFKKTDEWKTLWDNYIRIMKIVERKYLPEEVQFNLSYPIEDTSELRKGLISMLWDTDGCYYSLKNENITITRRDFTTTFTFKYGSE